MQATNEVKPCRHVQRYVESQALGKPVRWWNILGWLHVKNCPQCQEALRRLNAYFNAIQQANETEEGESAEKILRVLRESSNQTPDQ
jgi:hypothetical protein